MIYVFGHVILLTLSFNDLVPFSILDVDQLERLNYIVLVIYCMGLGMQISYFEVMFYTIVANITLIYIKLVEKELTHGVDSL